MEKQSRKKQRKIFGKIFWPIVSILVLFAIVTLLFNYFSVDRFVKENAKEKLEVAYNDVREQIRNFVASSDKDFKLMPSENLVNQSNNTKVYVFDDNYKEVALFDNTIYIDSEMTSFLADLLINFELEEGVLTTIRFNGREYLANTYEANSNLNISEKYFVIVQDLTDKTLLLRENSKNMLIVQILILMLTVLIVFIVARDLSKPLIKLSKESEEYIIGKGITIDADKMTIEELEILRESLYNMQQKIDEENNRKNTIYENVAHDLRTPLVSILGYADGLKNGIIKDKNKACDVILRTGNQLKEMIENILVLSRFDNDTYKSNKEEIDLIDLINEQVEMVKAIDESKKVMFENDLADSEVIFSDRKLIIRIVQNLLSNAIKYAKEKVIIKLSNVTGKTAYKIIVADDGEGIDENNIENIFTRYYKGVDGHFGIGLAAVKSSLDYLGGNIDVESNMGEGTKFIIEI